MGECVCVWGGEGGGVVICSLPPGLYTYIKLCNF